MNERGFALIELMVTLLIVAILVLVAIPVFFGARQRAQDGATQQMLVNGAKIQAVWHADNAGYTDDVAVLSAEESSLDWSGSSDDAIHVVISVDAEEVLLYARSATGTWFGIRLDGGDRSTCSGPAQSDVDTLAACTGLDW